MIPFSFSFPVSVVPVFSVFHLPTRNEETGNKKWETGNEKSETKIAVSKSTAESLRDCLHQWCAVTSTVCSRNLYY